MKIIRKLVLLCLLPALCLALLGGCAKKPTAEDAAQYVQAVIDVICTGAYDGEVAFSDVQSGEVGRFRQQIIDEALESYRSQDASLNEDTLALIRDTLTMAFSKCRYTVGQAVQAGDGFDVPVEVSPLKLFNVDMEAVQAQAVEELSSQTDLLSLSDDEVINGVYNVLFRLIGEDLESPSYCDPVSVTVHYGPLSDGLYGASEEDCKAIWENLFSMEGLQ